MPHPISGIFKETVAAIVSIETNNQTGLQRVIVTIINEQKKIVACFIDMIQRELIDCQYALDMFIETFQTVKPMLF